MGLLLTLMVADLICLLLPARRPYGCESISAQSLKLCFAIDRIVASLAFANCSGVSGYSCTFVHQQTIDGAALHFNAASHLACIFVLLGPQTVFSRAI